MGVEMSVPRVYVSVATLQQALTAPPSHKWLVACHDTSCTHVRVRVRGTHLCTARASAGTCTFVRTPRRDAYLMGK
jgi:hypothetical protein